MYNLVWDGCHGRVRLEEYLREGSRGEPGLYVWMYVCMYLMYVCIPWPAAVYRSRVVSMVAYLPHSVIFTLLYFSFFSSPFPLPFYLQSVVAFPQVQPQRTRQAHHIPWACPAASPTTRGKLCHSLSVFSAASKVLGHRETASKRPTSKGGTADHVAMKS